MNVKARKTAFTVTASVMAVFTVLAAGIFCDLTAFPIIEVNEANNIHVDGTDFSGLVELGTVITDSIIRTAAASITVIAALIIALAVWGIFRCIVLKDSPAVCKNELIFSLRFFLISSAAPFFVTLVYAVVCAVKIGNGAPFWALLLCLPNSLFIWLFYILKLRKLAA